MAGQNEVSQLPEMPEIRNLSIGYCHLCHCDGEKVVMAGNGWEWLILGGYLC